jgi:hypothetical protein
MTKTFALLLDSYRELNAKRLFWIVLMLSGLVVGICAMIGLKNDTLTVLGFRTPLQFEILSKIKPVLLYKLMFSVFGLGFWLTWIANILALISTAGIFPDFMAGGSIDLYLCKPISRFRLFLTKYMGGLLFVTLQASIFAVCSFVLIGTRGGSWEPAIFLSIPLVVLVFSYLFSVCVLLGVTTRSTITALLLTLLFWFAIWCVQVGEGWSLSKSIETDLRVEALDQQIADANTKLAAFPPTTGPATSTSVPKHSRKVLGFFGGPDSRTDVEDQIKQLKAQRQDLIGSFHSLHGYLYAAMFPLPKTGATVDLIDRELIKRADMPQTDLDGTDDSDSSSSQRYADDGPGSERLPQNQRMIRRRMSKAQRSESAVKILGTSIGFELVVFSVAAWRFCRRDY